MNQSRNKLRIISINIIDNNMAYLLSRNYSMYYYPLNIQIIYNKKKYKFHRNEKNELTFECLGE